MDAGQAHWAVQSPEAGLSAGFQKQEGAACRGKHEGPRTGGHRTLDSWPVLRRNQQVRGAMLVCSTGGHRAGLGLVAPHVLSATVESLAHQLLAGGSLPQEAPGLFPWPRGHWAGRVGPVARAGMVSHSATTMTSGRGLGFWTRPEMRAEVGAGYGDESMWPG